MSNEVVVQDKKELVSTFEVDGNEIKLTPSIVQNYIVSGGGNITTQEFMFFTALCKARKLNPFTKEAYCIKFGNNPAQIVVGKDAVLKRAITNPQFDGLESGIIVQDKNGEITERKGTFYIKADERIVGGWARVYRKNWEHPTYCSVSFDEVAQKKSDGTLNANWAGKGATMVEKVAKVRALRETFVEDLGGMYDADEMGIDISQDTKKATVPVQEQPVIEQGEPSEFSDEEVSLADL